MALTNLHTKFDFSHPIGKIQINNDKNFQIESFNETVLKKCVLEKLKSASEIASFKK